MNARAARLRRLLGEVEPAHLPGWLRPTARESRWPAGIAILAAIGLQVLLPQDLAFAPRWLLPAIELGLFLTLVIENPLRVNRESMVLRTVSIALVAVASLAIAWSAGRLVYHLVTGADRDSAAALLLNGGAIWLTNVIVFALWYWEVDRGGPAARAAARHDYPDFLFAQMTAPEMTSWDWEPRFADYLYLSFTNATAFSPTDTLPLTARVKTLMGIQSAISLLTIAIIAARAVNVL